MREVRFGIIGCGTMGREFASAAARWLHLPAMRARPRVVAVCNRTLNVPKVDWFRENIPTVRQVTSDYRELLRNPEVEAVYIAVPHNLHEELYIAALDAGKHLMGEKPFGIDRTANAAILAAVEKHPKCFVRCASQFLFFPAVQRIGRMVVAYSRSGREVTTADLEVDGAMEVGIEMHSLSKTYNMTGWRIGMACGNPEIVAGLGRVKTNVDSGAFDAIQHAAITALTGPQDCVREACSVYQERRDVLVKGLTEIGLDVRAPKATFYVWAPVDDSMAFSAQLLDKAGIVATPGVGFGKNGEGFVRFAITRSIERINEAVDRMRGLDL